MCSKEITVLIDNESWILPYGEQIVETLIDNGYSAVMARSAEEVRSGWVNFILGCTRIISGHVLALNSHNIVVHESNLPSGRGFAPMSWQVLEGKKSIPICLIEAVEEVDSGDIWIKDHIILTGDELCDDWRRLQGEKTIELCLRFVFEYGSLIPKKQVGISSYYERRRPDASRLDPDKTIKEQMNLLRIVDNHRYPAFFEINGIKYYLHISK